MLKTCSKCHQTKSTDDFYRHHKHVYQAYCKECEHERKSYKISVWKENRDLYRKQARLAMRAWRARKKDNPNA